MTASGTATRSVFLSTNKGANWKAVKLPRKRRVGARFGVDFLSPKLGYLLDRDQHLWKTTNGGRTWTQLLGAGTSDVIAIAMANAKEGFIGLRRFAERGGSSLAHVLRTSDGGRTWRPQAIARGDLSAVLAGGAQQAYALVGENHLFFTASGGDAGVPSALTTETPIRNFTARGLKKAKGRVTVTGTLAGAVGGEQIVVSRRDLAGSRWTHQTVTAGANGGRFTTSWKISRSSVFVAQWAGDSGRRGAGSAALVVTVKKAKN
jgi:hypothetical protein